MEELEDKWDRFFRNTNIDIKSIAEAAFGGEDADLSNYYTKTESNVITDNLADRIDELESAPPIDLTDYYTKIQTDSSINALDARLDSVEARPIIDSPDDIGAAPVVHTHSYDSLTSKPTTFAPSAGTNFSRVTVASWEAERGSNYFIAHRGSGDVVPENSLEAFEYAIQAGAKCMEVSVVQTADKQLVVNHDLTWDRTSNATGNVSSTPSTILKQISLNKMLQTGPGWNGTNAPKPVLFEEILRRFGGRVVMCCEAKNDSCYTAMVAMLERYGLKDSTIIKAFYSSSRLAQAKTAGYKTFGYVGVGEITTNNMNALVAANTDYIVIPGYTGDDTTLISTTLINTALASGKTVWVYPLHRRVDSSYFFSNGVAGVISSNYGYTASSTALVTVDDWAYQTNAPGQLVFGPSNANFAPTYTAPNIINLNKQSQQHFISLGQFAPITATTYQIDFDASWTTLPADTSKLLAIAFGQGDDKYYELQSTTTSSGYHAYCRANGVVNFAMHNPTTVSLGQADVTTAAAVAGTWMHFRLNVTPTQITWARTDVSAPNSVTVTNNTYRGGYIHIGKNALDGVLSLRSLAIT